MSLHNHFVDNVLYSALQRKIPDGYIFLKISLTGLSNRFILRFVRKNAGT